MFNPKHLAVIRELINHPINEAALRWLVEVERLGLEADLGGGRQIVSTFWLSSGER